jgi:sulfur carrier protein
MLHLQINGTSRALEVEQPSTLEQVLSHLGVQFDRIAVEHNGLIVARTAWAQTDVTPDDRLEIVHFVGGGADAGSDYTEYVLSDIDYSGTA